MIERSVYALDLCIAVQLYNNTAKENNFTCVAQLPMSKTEVIVAKKLSFFRIEVFSVLAPGEKMFKIDNSSTSKRGRSA